LIITTTNDIAGRPIAAYLGVVRGIVVRSPGIARGFAGALQSISGGNVDAFTQVCDEARREAFERMIAHAQHLGADAVIGMRYDATEFSQQATEVLAYGTAVKLADSAVTAQAVG
jgi:uncharacterized protein YbjQ (UPF0145 family)